MLNSNRSMKVIRAAIQSCVLLLLVSCGGGGGSSPPPVNPPQRNVAITWSANHEAAVNRTGGGYRVYYSNTPNFAIGSATQVDVPYVSGPTSPVTNTLTLVAGTYYIKVVAYSTLNPAGSTPSAEIQVVVP